MFYFKVETNFSPLKLLKEQIINLRNSAKKNSRYESQAEANRDAATLREVMELIEDFKLEIDIPTDFILKFMVPTSSVPVQSTHMQASHTVTQNSCIAHSWHKPSSKLWYGTVYVVARSTTFTPRWF
ncbi:hypothetical protein HA466_0121970 [Hirschfeldia incana]|nr:hypothetical protein HA466_0121970 [Hirschfeldia incana]